MPTNSPRRSKPPTQAAAAPEFAWIAASIRCHAVPVGDITADPANLNKHGPESIAAIKASLKRFGQRKAIVADANGVTMAGAGVLEAARQLGWSHVAATRDADLSQTERVLYGIADNRTARLSELDAEALARVLPTLDAADLEATGFTAEDLAELVRGAAGAGEVVQDEIPEVQKTAISRAGDLWCMGEHRLLCGDSTDPAHVKRLMRGERATLFATDPPYLVGYDGTNHPGTVKSKSRPSLNTDWSESYGTSWDDHDPNSDLYARFIAAAIAEAVAEGAVWYCWYASRRHTLLEAVWIKSGILPHCQIIWVKNRSVMTRTWYLWQHEPCLMGWKKGNKPGKLKDQPMLSTVWAVDTIPNGDERPEHPTPKPLELFAIPMRQHTRPGDLCFEPFSGSGTQIIVAEQLQRRCFAMDSQPLYIDVAIRRWQALTGRQAILDGAGRSWDAVVAERSAVTG